MAHKHDKGLYLTGPKKGQKDFELADCEDPAPGLGTVQKWIFIVGSLVVLIFIIIDLVSHPAQVFSGS